MKRTAAKSAKRQMPPEVVPGFDPQKDAAVVRCGRSVFLYGKASPNSRFRRLRDDLQVEDVAAPPKPPTGPKPKKENIFRTWQAAERFFAKENNQEGGLLAYGPGSCFFHSPSLAAGFARALKNRSPR